MQENPGWIGFEGVSDEALCRLMQDGNVDAGDELARRSIILVRRRARALLAGGLEIDDLAQEGMLGLIDAMKAYRPDRGASFRTFAYRCVTNRMLNLIAASGRNPSQVSFDHIGNLEPLTEEQIPNAKDPQEILIQQENTFDWIHRARNLLSKTEREALRLYLGGYTYQEMAASLQCTTKAVDNALQRVRRKLRTV
ncbi:MAG TPA: sigma-70 family RNA polymerase sigma factor [Candidatus Fimivivens faecavium]|nr:sigma-70 family RNA polymerase sigma factor [Candidatus Fimivivens faecavium]